MMTRSTSLYTAENLYYLMMTAREQKKNGSLFYVTMGSHDRAEICKLVELFLLLYYFCN